MIVETSYHSESWLSCVLAQTSGMAPVFESSSSVLWSTFFLPSVHQTPHRQGPQGLTLRLDTVFSYFTSYWGAKPSMVCKSGS